MQQVAGVGGGGGEAFLPPVSPQENLSLSGCGLCRQPPALGCFFSRTMEPRRPPKAGQGVSKGLGDYDSRMGHSGQEA